MRNLLARCVIGMLSVALVSSAGAAPVTFTFDFDNRGIGASAPAMPPFVGTGTVTLATDPGAGTFALNSLGGFSMSFVFGADTFSATTASNSEISTPLANVEVVITLVTGVENLVFSGSDGGSFRGSLDFTNPSNEFLSFEPAARVHYVEGIVGTGGPVAANSGVYSAIQTPLPPALPLFATGLGALGLLGWRRKRKAQAAA